MGKLWVLRSPKPGFREAGLELGYTVSGRFLSTSSKIRRASLASSSPPSLKTVCSISAAGARMFVPVEARFDVQVD